MNLPIPPFSTLLLPLNSDEFFFLVMRLGRLKSLMNERMAFRENFCHDIPDERFPPPSPSPPPKKESLKS